MFPDPVKTNVPFHSLPAYFQNFEGFSAYIEGNHCYLNSPEDGSSEISYWVDIGFPEENLVKNGEEIFLCNPLQETEPIFTLTDPCDILESLRVHDPVTTEFLPEPSFVKTSSEGEETVNSEENEEEENA